MTTKEGHRIPILHIRHRQCVRETVQPMHCGFLPRIALTRSPASDAAALPNLPADVTLPLAFPLAHRPRFVLLFSHGNAEDIGLNKPFCEWLSAELKVDVVTYDYVGYGLAEGEPCEKYLYQCIDAVYAYLRCAAALRAAGLSDHDGGLSVVTLPFPPSLVFWLQQAGPATARGPHIVVWQVARQLAYRRPRCAGALPRYHLGVALGVRQPRALPNLHQSAAGQVSAAHIARLGC